MCTEIARLRALLSWNTYLRLYSGAQAMLVEILAFATSVRVSRQSTLSLLRNQTNFSEDCFRNPLRRMKFDSVVRKNNGDRTEILSHCRLGLQHSDFFYPVRISRTSAMFANASYRALHKPVLFTTQFRSSIGVIRTSKEAFLQICNYSVRVPRSKRPTLVILKWTPDPLVCSTNVTKFTQQD